MSIATSACQTVLKIPQDIATIPHVDLLACQIHYIKHRRIAHQHAAAKAGPATWLWNQILGSGRRDSLDACGVQGGNCSRDLCLACRPGHKHGVWRSIAKMNLLRVDACRSLHEPAGTLTMNGYADKAQAGHNRASSYVEASTEQLQA